MSDSQQGHFPVYTGMWTNWSSGQVRGATLTLTRRDANLLIAFVAFFIALVGTRLWRILCLVIHFSLSSDKPRDAMHHQRQAVIRNAADAEVGIFSLSNLMWAWRGRDNNPYFRVGGLVALSVVWFFAFILIGGYSSLISSVMDDEVLLLGTNCAIQATGATDNLTIEDTDRLRSYMASQVAEAANTAAHCSKGCVGGMLGCNTFATRELPLERRDTNANCPFGGNICANKDSNLLLDTGFIDSHDHLGINSLPQERFAYRRRMHCAPLKTEGLKEEVSVAGERRTTTRYFYGRQWNSGTETNYTYEYVNHEMNDTQKMIPVDYTVGVRAARYMNGSLLEFNSDVDVIPELQVPDSNTYLYFLSANDIIFLAPSSDPWYRIKTENLISSSDSNNVTQPTARSWIQSEAASPMACTIQEQYCNPNRPTLDLNRCGPLTTPVDAQQKAIDAGVFPDKAKMSKRLDWARLSGFGTGYDPSQVVKFLGSFSLSVRRNLMGWSQSGLATNQWMQDVEYWHKTSMSSIQIAMIDSVVGSHLRPATVYTRKPKVVEEFQLCNNQKIRSTNHGSFSVVGLVVVFGLGMLIVMVSYTLDPLLGWLARDYDIKRHQYFEWCSNEILQLHRLAHEEAGESFWQDGTRVAHFTNKGSLLASLDVTDPKHPRLKRQSRYTWDPNTGTFSLREAYSRANSMKTAPRRWSPE